MSRGTSQTTSSGFSGTLVELARELAPGKASGTNGQCEGDAQVFNDTCLFEFGYYAAGSEPLGTSADLYALWSQVCEGRGVRLKTALTARLTRDGKSSDYELTGRLVKRDLAFSYFFLEEEGGTSIRPWGETAREFSRLFQSSYTSTALTSGYTKEDGQLHETEMLTPCSREGKATLLRGVMR